MNLKKLFASAIKIATPVAKVVGPAVLVAVVTHTSVKNAVLNAAKGAAGQNKTAGDLIAVVDDIVAKKRTPA